MRLLLVCALFSASGAFAGVPEIPELTGKVVDVDSGRPIVDAIVIANVGGEGGSMFGHGHHRQLLCTAVRTDVQGRYRIPAWTWSGGRSMSLDLFGATLNAYHPDYTFYSSDGTAAVLQRVPTIPLIGTFLRPSEATIPMRRFVKGDRKAWDLKLGLPLDFFQCDWDADVKNADLVWESMREEVEAFDGENNSTRGLKRKLEFVTKRPPSSQPQPLRPPPVDIQIRSPTAPASSAPAGARER